MARIRDLREWVTQAELARVVAAPTLDVVGAEQNAGVVVAGGYGDGHRASKAHANWNVAGHASDRNRAAVARETDLAPAVESPASNETRFRRVSRGRQGRIKNDAGTRCSAGSGGP